MISNRDGRILVCQISQEKNYKTIYYLVGVTCVTLWFTSGLVGAPCGNPSSCLDHDCYKTATRIWQVRSGVCRQDLLDVNDTGRKCDTLIAGQPIDEMANGNPTCSTGSMLAVYATGCSTPTGKVGTKSCCMACVLRD